MFDLVKQHLSQIISFITGLAGGSFLTLRLTREQRATGKAVIADQRRAQAGGDIVGRDKITSATNGPLKQTDPTDGNV